MEALKRMLFEEKVPFSNKRDLNKSGMLKLSGLLILVVVVGILMMPAKPPEQTVFQEKVDASGTVISKIKDIDPTNQAIAEMKASQANLKQMPKTQQASPAYGGGTGSFSPKAIGSADRNVTMIVARSGSDTRNSLSAGTRINIVLQESVTIGSQNVPVTGLVTADVISENSLAIPEGSKVIGDASFDDTSERANLNWKSIILPDGRERPFAALTIGGDTKVGVEGNVHSDSLKNTVGQTLTGFMGAYASGAMSSGMLGATDGGVQNGLKNAVATTAKDRASSFGEELKKEHKWIELHSGTGVTAILSQSFVFREQGSSNGQ